MKSKFTVSLLCLLLLSSCVNKVVRPKETDKIDSKIKVGKNYTFKNLHGSKAKSKVLKMDDTTISGIDIDFKNYSLEKNQVAEVRKSNTWGTRLIAAGVAAAILIVPAYATNKPVVGR